MSDQNERDAKKPEQDAGADFDERATADTDSNENTEEGTTGEVIPSGSSGGALSGAGNVEVPVEALHGAVGELRQLITLRQEESERQEQAIGAMHSAIRRQGRTNALLAIASLVLLAVAGAGVFHFTQLQTVNEEVAGKVDNLGGEFTVTQETVKAATQQVNEAVNRQTETLSGLELAVSATRTEQAERLASVEAGLARSLSVVGDEQATAVAAVRDAVEVAGQEQSKRLAAVEAELARSLSAAGDEQATAVAAVRDAVEVASQEQSKRLALANEEVTRTLTEVASGQTLALTSVNDQLSTLQAKQALELEALREQLAAARADNAELTRMLDEKLSSAEQAIAVQVEESIAAVRAERDQIQAEMTRLLEQRMIEFTVREDELQQREDTLEAEKAKFAQQVVDQREGMRALLSNALQGLEPTAAEPASMPQTDTAREAIPDGGAVSEAPELSPET